MVIYLRHPKHGTKVASLREEADQDIKNGWVEFDPIAEQAVAQVTKEVAVEESVVETAKKTKKSEKSVLDELI